MRVLAIAVCTAALAAIAFSDGSASATTTAGCHTRVYKNGPVYVTSTRGLTCAAAAKEQRRYAWTGNNAFRTPGGYNCKPSGRGAVGYQIRCVKGSLAYRIEFAD